MSNIVGALQMMWAPEMSARMSARISRANAWWTVKVARRALGSFWLTLLLSIHIAHAASNTSVIDVRWDVTIYPDKALKATNLGDFKALLEANWSEKTSVIVKKDKQSTGEKFQLQNCRQLFDVERYLYETEDPTDWPILMQSLLRCKAMEIMTRLQPSKVSYVNTDVRSMVPDLAKLRLQSNSDPVRT